MPTPEVTVEDLAAARHTGTVLDVREPAEYAAGHVPGAMLVPMTRLAVSPPALDPQRRVYVVCATGNRSRAMTDLLCARGFDAVSVAGGTEAWVRSGRPVEGGLR
ncbi:MAG TPA: rhodanese-like domain-containing protein [Marmoricola sp.]|nr:rhodanese-like domain-containing protein [Marmoricola sp.]